MSNLVEQPEEITWIDLSFNELVTIDEVRKQKARMILLIASSFTENQNPHLLGTFTLPQTIIAISARKFHQEYFRGG